MVHVPTELVRGDRVDHLLHSRHAERRDVHDLGLTTLEERGTVSHREEVDLCGQWTNVSDTASVNTNALFDDATTNELLRDRLHRGLDLAGAVRELTGQLLDDRSGRGTQRIVASGLRGQVVRFAERAGADGVHAGVHVILEVLHGLVLDGLDWTTSRDELLHELALQIDRFADPELRCFQSSRKNVFADLGRTVGVLHERTFGTAGLDHHDGNVGVRRVTQRASGDDELERGGITFGEGGVRGPLTVSGVGHAYGADRAVERNARDHQGCRSGVDGENVVRVFLVGAEDGADDLGFVAKVLRERGTQGTVDQTTDQDGLVREFSLAAKERPGNLARGVRALFDVDGEGKEVDAFTHGTCGGDGRQQHRVANAGQYGSVGELCEATCFETQSFVGARYWATYADCVSHGFAPYAVSNTPPGSQ